MSITALKCDDYFWHVSLTCVTLVTFRWFGSSIARLAERLRSK